MKVVEREPVQEDAQQQVIWHWEGDLAERKPWRQQKDEGDWLKGEEQKTCLVFLLLSVVRSVRVGDTFPLNIWSNHFQ